LQIKPDLAQFEIWIDERPEMTKFISFDMDGTLIAPEYTDWVWGYGIPSLYAKKSGLSFDAAKTFVVEEYQKVGEGSIEWYDIKYWFQLFQLEEDWRVLMERFVDKISVYSDVDHTLGRLKDKFPLVLTTNAGKEFIDVEMEATGLKRYFDRIFSATSDFGEVKKTPRFYRRICQILQTDPNEVVHVGDHYEFDYLVPQQLGMDAFYLDRTGQRRGDFILSDLRDLEKRLQKLRPTDS
jgi:putative hydrolase of the HAD superfamily